MSQAKLPKAILPLKNPKDMFDDWDDLEVDNKHRNLAKGCIETADQNLENTERTFAAKANIVGEE